MTSALAHDGNAESVSPRVDLVVRSMTPVADGILAAVFEAVAGQPLPAWSPGAHIELLLGNGLVRQYSLCGDIHNPCQWRIATRLEPEGRGGSVWIHQNLRQGDRVQAMGPRNNFALEDSRRYVLVAGGIGITPILPMARKLDDSGSDWSLLYLGRKLSGMAFLDELAQFGSRVRIHAADRDGRADIGAWLGPPDQDAAVYCCGPERLLDTLEALCAFWPEKSFHAERFHPPSAVKSRPTGSFILDLTRSKISCTVEADETILDALDRIGIHVPRSCGEGMCGTCLTGVTGGVPDHRDSFLIGKKRRENKAICPCCSRSISPRLALDL